MTPADKPDLPHKGVVTREEAGILYAYTQAAIDAIRADERRKALEEAARIADGYPGAHSDDIARDIRALDRKEPTK